MERRSQPTARPKDDVPEEKGFGRDVAVGSRTTPDEAPRGARAVPPSEQAVTAALCGMGAAWVAAGSTGLLAHPLRHALSWLALAVAVVAVWPANRRTWLDWVVLLGAAVAAAVMTMPVAPVYNVLAVPVVLAVLAWVTRGIDRQTLLVAALAAAVFGIYRLACTSIPAVWLVADWTGSGLGRLAGMLCGKPLWVGITFGGVDFLILMAGLLVGWLACTRPPRVPRAAYAAVAILAGHVVYLCVLAWAPDLKAALPDTPPPPESDLYVPPDWSWTSAVGSLLPWNVPLLAVLLHLAVAAAMFRWADWLPEESSRQQAAGSGQHSSIINHHSSICPLVAPLLLAGLVPPVTMLSLGTSSLAGKKIVAPDEGYLDWEKPIYDSYGQMSAGLYGMLPTFVESLGGRFVRSADLAGADLADADLLLLIHPVQPWTDQRRARVWEFVRGGGSLLVVAEPRVHEEGFLSAFDEVLEPAALKVRFDTAISQTGHWQHSGDVMAHPATAGIDDRRNRFGMVGASSIEVGWPGRPLLVGRWGWSDPGSDAVLTEVFRYDAGEKLGDLVLAAEQPVGRGRVLVLGDTSSLTNEGNAECYEFTGRLLAYLAGSLKGSPAGWRQALGVIGCLLLMGMLLRGPEPTQLAAVCLLLAFSTAISLSAGRIQSQVLPTADATRDDTRIACIDASHLEAQGDFGWGYEGIAGLKLTLMRNGYLPLVLLELTAARLEHAELLILIAPARRFSETQRAVVGQYVESGGILICTAGADRAGATNGLLREFGLRVPPSPLRPPKNAEEPRPMGHFRSPYLDAGDYKAHVMFYAGWPIECPADGATEVLARGFDDVPVAAVRHVGRGKVVLIGDTGFAMNKNLEYVGGEPFDGGYENAHFWRWLIAELTGRPEWVPPPPPEEESEEPEEPMPLEAAGQQPVAIEESAESESDEEGP